MVKPGSWINRVSRGRIKIGLKSKVVLYLKVFHVAPGKAPETHMFMYLKKTDIKVR